MHVCDLLGDDERRLYCHNVMTQPIGASASGIGASLKRKEDRRFVTGRGRYLDDITTPRPLHARIARSPHAHARIDRIDATPNITRRLPG